MSSPNLFINVEDGEAHHKNYTRLDSPTSPLNSSTERESPPPVVTDALTSESITLIVDDKLKPTFVPASSGKRPPTPVLKTKTLSPLSLSEPDDICRPPRRDSPVITASISLSNPQASPLLSRSEGSESGDSQDEENLSPTRRSSGPFQNTTTMKLDYNNKFATPTRGRSRSYCPHPSSIGLDSTSLGIRDDSVIADKEIATPKDIRVRSNSMVNSKINTGSFQHTPRSRKKKSPFSLTQFFLLHIVPKSLRGSKQAQLKFLRWVFIFYTIILLSIAAVSMYSTYSATTKTLFKHTAESMLSSYLHQGKLAIELSHPDITPVLRLTTLAELPLLTNGWGDNQNDLLSVANTLMLSLVNGNLENTQIGLLTIFSSLPDTYEYITIETAGEEDSYMLIRTLMLATPQSSNITAFIYNSRDDSLIAIDPSEITLASPPSFFTYKNISDPDTWSYSTEFSLNPFLFASERPHFLSNDLTLLSPDNAYGTDVSLGPYFTVLSTGTYLEQYSTALTGNLHDPFFLDEVGIVYLFEETTGLYLGSNLMDTNILVNTENSRLTLAQAEALFTNEDLTDLINVISNDITNNNNNNNNNNDNDNDSNSGNPDCSDIDSTYYYCALRFPHTFLSLDGSIVNDYIMISATFNMGLGQHHMNLAAYIGWGIVAFLILVFSVVSGLSAFSSYKYFSKTTDKKKNSKGINLDAQMESLVARLKTIRDDMARDEDRQAITSILNALSNQSNLFMPDLDVNSGKLDKESKKWVLEQLMSNEKKSTPSFLRENLAARGRTSSRISVMISPSEVNQTDSDFLKKLGAWDYHCFDIENPLEVVTMAVLECRNIFKRLNIPKERVRLFLRTIESHYRENPYHNACHAGDVVQCLYFLLNQGLSKKIGGDPLDIFTFVLAGACHDVDHPGVNQAFLNNQLDPLSILYNDRSVLENHHAAFSFNILTNNFGDILDSFSPEKRKYFRDMFIQLILATDMSKHLETMGKFKLNSMSDTYDPLAKQEDKIQLLQVALKFADVSNTSRPRDVMQLWCNRLVDEFFLQGDQERKKKVPISVYMDRDDCHIPSFQSTFIELVGKPLIEALDGFIDMEDPTDFLNDNLEFWSALNASSKDQFDSDRNESDREL